MLIEDYKKATIAIVLLLIPLGAVSLRFKMPGVIITSLLLLIIASALQFRFLKRIYKKSEEHKRNLYLQVEALKNLHSQLNFKHPLPPLGGMALSAPVLIRLVEIILREEPEQILEFGSGVSTVVLAKALARSGTGCIYSLDHKAKYAQKTSQQIKLQGISPYASVHHTPLAELNSAGKNQRWYDMNLNEIIKNKIDLLIIDGPPGIPGENNREPGLYEAAPLMAESISILVDDIHREDEKSMIKRWTQDNPKFKKEEIAGDNQAILLTKTKTSE